MSTILRTMRNIYRIGIRDYLHQMQYIGDTKAGTYIASDRYGNKYYENVDDELPLRTRWVDYKEKEYSPYVRSLSLLSSKRTGFQPQLKRPGELKWN